MNTSVRLEKLPTRILFMTQSQVSLKVGDLWQDFGYVEFHDNSATESVLHEPSHEILRKRVTVEFNKNSKKPSNPAIRTADYTVDEKHALAHDTRYAKQGYFSLMPNGQQDDFLNFHIENNMAEGITPSSMLWNDTPIKSQSDCQAANLNRTSITPALIHYPMIHPHYAIQPHSSLNTNAKLSKKRNHGSESQTPVYTKYNQYYRQLKTSGIDNCQRVANPENYKHRIEAISTRVRRIARLHAALNRLRF